MKLISNPACLSAATQCHYDCYNFKGSDGQALKTNSVAACKVRAVPTQRIL